MVTDQQIRRLFMLKEKENSKTIRPDWKPAAPLRYSHADMFSKLFRPYHEL